MKQFSVILLLIILTGSYTSYSSNKNNLLPKQSLLLNDIAAGPFLSFPGSFYVNNSYSIKAKITNLGTNPQFNFPVRFFINGLVITGFTINNLPAGAIDSVSFNWIPSVAGFYTLKIASALATDENRLNDTVTASILVLPPGPPVNQFCRNGLNILIPAQGSAPRDSIIVNFSSGYYLLDVNVKIDTVFHTWDSDLIFNIKHGLTNVNIINSVGGSGDNFIGTILNDSASINIGNGTAPFTGSYIPSSSLNVFNGLLANGSWVLGIDDGAAGDSGVLKAWCIQLIIHALNGGIQTIEIPNYYSLAQNYPNPFNPSTSIKYSVPTPTNVTLKIYDVLGKEVATLVNEMKQPGFHTVDFNATDLASGIYFYRIDAGEFTSVKRMVLVK